MTSLRSWRLTSSSSSAGTWCKCIRIMEGEWTGGEGGTRQFTIYVVRAFPMCWLLPTRFPPNGFWRKLLDWATDLCIKRPIHIRTCPPWLSVMSAASVREHVRCHPHTYGHFWSDQTEGVICKDNMRQKQRTAITGGTLCAEERKTKIRTKIWLYHQK
jgi:hypothetical protein